MTDVMAGVSFLGLFTTRSDAAQPAILWMHIRPDQLHSSAVVGCKDTAAQQFFIFLNHRALCVAP
jgi:hypothetical protein